MIDLDLSAVGELLDLRSHWTAILEKFNQLRDAVPSVEGVSGSPISPEQLEVTALGRTIRLTIVPKKAGGWGALSGEVVCTVVGPHFLERPPVFMAFDISSSGQTNFLTDHGRVVHLGQHRDVAAAVLSFVVREGLKVRVRPNDEPAG